MTHSLYPVILCGGSGTRLWPMSRRLLPKQFLALASDRTLFQESIARLSLLDGAAPCTVVCSEDHRFLAAEQMRQIGLTAAELILEPSPRGTAPAIALAALSALERHDEAILFVAPSDLLIRDNPAFQQAAGRALNAARQGHLVTFGVAPNHPATGYGYMEKGVPLEGSGVHRVARFVEKPIRETAEAYLASGRYYWNSGMFVFSARRVLEEMQTQRPAIVASARSAWSSRTRDADFTRPGAEAFAACPSDSIDYAIMERTESAAMVEATFSWSDIGSWSALWEVGQKDVDGNVRVGDVDAASTTNSYLRAESRLLSVLGVDGVVVVETADAVLVTRRSLSQEVKDVVARLEQHGRPEHVSHRRVYRPWGYYESLDAETGYQVKRLMVKPGEALSLQLHHRRAEHWVVVSGTAEVTCDDRVLRLGPNQSTYIPIGARHRLANRSTDPLFVIEVQSGDYLGEDDIVRLEDRYARG